MEINDQKKKKKRKKERKEKEIKCRMWDVSSYTLVSHSFHKVYNGYKALNKHVFKINIPYKFHNSRNA